jgi:hypothetical protein
MPNGLIENPMVRTPREISFTPAARSKQGEVKMSSYRRASKFAAASGADFSWYRDVPDVRGDQLSESFLPRFAPRNPVESRRRFLAGPSALCSALSHRIPPTCSADVSVSC